VVIIAIVKKLKNYHNGAEHYFGSFRNVRTDKVWSSELQLARCL